MTCFRTGVSSWVLVVGGWKRNSKPFKRRISAPAVPSRTSISISSRKYRLAGQYPMKANTIVSTLFNVIRNRRSVRIRRF